MKLIIHIGYPKTATTSLQKDFFPKIRNVNYLGTISTQKGSYKLVNDSLTKILYELMYSSDSNWEKSLKLHQEYFNKALNSSMVNLLSYEQLIFHSTFYKNINGKLFKPSVEMISQRLSQLFIDIEITIVITLRKQVELISSLYAEAYQHHYRTDSNLNSFDKYLDAINDGFLNDVLNFNSLIECYSNQFGKDSIKILVYEEMKIEEKSFLNKLNRIIGSNSDIEGLSQLNVRKTKKGKISKSITLYEILGKIKLKLIGERSLGLEGTKIVQFLRSQEIPSLSDKILVDYKDKQKDIIQKHFNDSNKELDRKFRLNLDKFDYYQ